jgi:hypothetical protein
MERSILQMKKKRNLLKQYKATYKDQDIVVNVLKPKDKKEVNNGRSNTLTCPNCLSKLTLDSNKNQQCSGSQLKIWEVEFIKFQNLTEDKKTEYLKHVSYDSMFLELYDKWAYSVLHNKPEEYNCGYTNKIFLPIPSCQVTIPDPIQLTIVEKSIGRSLTEEEIFGEKELYYTQGVVTEEFTATSKKLKIRLIRFPEDC